jgi:hypothetical protein
MMTDHINRDNVCNLCLQSVDKTETFAKSKNIKGIYVWGYQADGQFVPLYVGKSRNIYERIIQHYCRFNGGEYIIPDVVFIDKAPATPYSIDRSKSFVPTDLASIHNMLNDNENTFNQKRQHIISNFLFAFLKLDDKTEREIAEKYLTDRIGEERLISSVPQLDPIPNNHLKDIIDKTFAEYYKPNQNQTSLL